MGQEKEIRWLGSAYEDLLEFPDDSRRQAGFQLGKVQGALEPEDWKPFDDVGPGTTQSTRAPGKSESGRRVELIG